MARTRRCIAEGFLVRASKMAGRSARMRKVGARRGWPCPRRRCRGRSGGRTQSCYRRPVCPRPNAMNALPESASTTQDVQTAPKRRSSASRCVDPFCPGIALHVSADRQRSQSRTWPREQAGSHRQVLCSPPWSLHGGGAIGSTGACRPQ